MKVAILNNYQPHIGKGKYCFNLFEKLREQKRLVDMIYLESKDNPYPETDGIVKVRQKINLPVFNKTFSWYFYFPKRIPKGYDLYHLTSGTLCKVAKYRKPSVLVHMDIAPLLFREYPFHMRYFVRRVMKYYSEVERIIAISERSKNELVETGVVPADMVDVVCIGFDERVYHPMPKEKCRKMLGIGEGEKIILNVGSEEERKNVKTLLEALHILKKGGLEFTLIRIGSRNPVLDGLKKGLDIRHFHGLPEKDMPVYYNASDIFVFPAVYEGGIAYPPMEAMACGIPTVVTEELDVFSEGAIVADAYDAAALAGKIKEILSSEKAAGKMSKAAVETAKCFTLTKEAIETYNVYEKILS